ncbi:O-antigen ligase [Pseudomonas sp. M30-35]|uniref:O-antigen ligase family protein n=1 Tax=Pseudomonas sp. M30-35 TaxID=1981174 RepID=UPI002113C6C0|nr:O-antigen ligase family protein [Pseudomonas sp. M30-35]
MNYATRLSNNPVLTMQSTSTAKMGAGTRLHALIQQYWIPLGYIVLLTGLIWVPNTSLYTKLYYGLFAFPALLGLILKPQYIKQLLSEPIVVCFVLFSAWLLLSLIWSLSDSSAASVAKRPVYVLMLFVGCAMMACKDEQLLLKALWLSAVIMAVGAVINLIHFLPNASSGARLIGTGAMRNPLLSSHVFGFFCTYWLAFWVTQQGRLSRYSFILALPLLAVLVETGSRTPLMALFAVTIWLMLISGKKGLYLFSAVCLAGLALYFFLPSSLMSRGFSYRPEIWQQALSIAQEKLWLGHGYQSEFMFTAGGRKLEDPHNVELAVMLDTGLIGLALWLAMYAALLRKTIELRHNKTIQLVSALVCYGVFAGLTEGSAFLSRPNENWFLTWIPVALVAALSIRQRMQASA